MIASIGWRPSWMIIGAAVAVVFMPVALGLLKDHHRRHARPDRSDGTDPADQKGIERQWTRREVIMDPNFYLILPYVLAPSFIVTGLLFHQVHLAESKG